MPVGIPALSQAWYSQIDVPFPSYADAKACQDSFLWTLKEMLKGTAAGGTLAVSAGASPSTRPAASLWTVVGSSNGVAAGLDAVDRWTTTFNQSLLVRANIGTAHSWIVLRNTTVGLWFLIDYVGSSDGFCRMSFAPTAYAGGSVTNAPTVAGSTEIAMGTAAVTNPISGFANESIFGGAGRSHLTVNADGTFYFCTSRIGSGLFNSAVCLGRTVDTTPGDNNPFFGTLLHGFSGRGAVAPWSSISNFFTVGMLTSSGGRANTGGPSTAAFGSSTFGGQAQIDSRNSRWPALALRIHDLTAGVQGDRGWFPDMWIVGAVTVGSPNTGVGVVVGDTLLPFQAEMAL